MNFITPAFAQAGPGGGGSFLVQLPQQRRQREHQEMISNVRRGDTVVMAGGIVGKITKVVDDAEAMIEVAEGVRIKIMKGMISEVRAKGEPVKDDSSKS